MTCEEDLFRMYYVIRNQAIAIILYSDKQCLAIFFTHCLELVTQAIRIDPQFSSHEKDLRESINKLSPTNPFLL